MSTIATAPAIDVFAQNIHLHKNSLDSGLLCKAEPAVAQGLRLAGAKAKLPRRPALGHNPANRTNC